MPTDTIALPRIASRPRPAVVAVLLHEMAQQGVRQLTAHPLRTALALIGMIVGVASVTSTRAMLHGVEDMMLLSFERFLGGSRGGIVRGVRTASRAGRQIQLEKIHGVTGDDRETFLDVVPELAITCPVSFAMETVTVGHTLLEGGIRVQGVGSRFLEIRQIPLVAGRFVTPDDQRTNARVAVLFRAFAVEAYGRDNVLGDNVLGDNVLGDNVLGETILIAGQPFTVVGLLGASASANQGWVRQAFIPYETAIARLGRDDRNTSTWIYARPGHTFAEISPTLLDVLLRRHPGAKKENFRVITLGTMQDNTLKEIRGRGRVLSAVAGLCLLAGTVGILNVMLVSVNERTREVGLRMALGATRLGILAQFLFEAVLLALVGAGIGLVFAKSLLFGMSDALRRRFTGDSFIDPTSINLGVGGTDVLLAVTLALSCALVAGTYPAWRASRLDPIESLRRE